MSLEGGEGKGGDGRGRGREGGREGGMIVIHILMCHNSPGA